MTKKVTVLNDDFLKEEAKSIAPLPAGTYAVVIEAIEPATIKSGIHQGKPALNVKLRHESNRVFFKLIPLFAVDAKSDEKTRTWVKMARVSFVEAFTPAISNTVLQANPGTLVGEVVSIVLGVQDNPGYGEQNVVKKFA